MSGPEILILLALVAVLGTWFYRDVQRHGMRAAAGDLATAFVGTVVLLGALYLLVGYP